MEPSYTKEAIDAFLEESGKLEQLGFLDILKRIHYARTNDMPHLRAYYVTLLNNRLGASLCFFQGTKKEEQL